MVTVLWYTLGPNLGSLSWFWRCKEHPCPWSPHFGLWRILEVPDVGLESAYWFSYGHQSLINQCSKYPYPLSPHLRLGRTLEVPDWGLVSWSWFSMVTSLWYNHDPSFGSLSWFWRCKEHPCPLSPHLGFGGRWRFLTGVWHLDLDLDMVIGLWYTLDLNFGSLSWFWRCKEHPCPLSPHLGL